MAINLETEALGLSPIDGTEIEFKSKSKSKFKSKSKSKFKFKSDVNYFLIQNS